MEIYIVVGCADGIPERVKAFIDLAKANSYSQELRKNSLDTTVCFDYLEIE